MALPNRLSGNRVQNRSMNVLSLTPIAPGSGRAETDTYSTACKAKTSAGWNVCRPKAQYTKYGTLYIESICSMVVASVFAKKIRFSRRYLLQYA